MNTNNYAMPVRFTLVTALLCAAGCVSSVRIPEPPSGVIAAPDGGAPGYQHGADRSRFSVGAQSHRLSEHGYSKRTGADGTLALDQFNGSVYGVPKASSSAQKLPPFGASPDDHAAFVLDYFRRSGIPADQIGSVQGRMLVEVTGRSDEKERAVPHVTGYYSVLQRVVAGVPVADSFAWARVNKAGQIVEEAVYWPALSRDTVTQARELYATWNDEKRRRELANRIQGDDTRTHIAIRHAAASSHDQFEAFACIDVYVKAAPVAADQAPQYAVTVAPSAASYVRHFDIAGIERVLPQERFELSRKFPPRKARPVASSEGAGS